MLLGSLIQFRHLKQIVADGDLKLQKIKYTVGGKEIGFTYNCIEDMSEQDNHCKLKGSIGPYVAPAHCHHQVLNSMSHMNLLNQYQAAIKYEK